MEARILFWIFFPNKIRCSLRSYVLILASLVMRPVLFQSET